MPETAWELFASVRPPRDPDDDETYGFFGPLGFAQHDTLANKVVRVWLEHTEDPEPGDHWAWLDLGARQPCHISATEAELTRALAVGDPNAPDPREEEKLGQGRILRLKVTVIEKVNVRSGRKGWRGITSAM